MGASKNGGYTKLESVTPEELSFLNNALKQAQSNQAGAAQGFNQFLPGGQGGKPIAEQANKNFQQQTIPAILNAFGQGSKGSSSLNQALAAGGANLNTDLASQLAQMQLQASQGLGNLGTSQGQLGLKDRFAYAPTQQPFWQQATLAGIGAAGAIGGGQASAGKKALGLF